MQNRLCSAKLCRLAYSREGARLKADAEGDPSEAFEAHLYQGQLGDLFDLYLRDDVLGSPTNIWPTDRSWVVYTDYDLWGTRVSGSVSLIDALRNDPELETVDLGV